MADGKEGDEYVKKKEKQAKASWKLYMIEITYANMYC